MAKKQSSVSMFERAGYALGSSKVRPRFNYLKGIAVAMKDIESITASIQKTQNLIKNNPDGIVIPKVSDSTFPKIQEWLFSVKPDIDNANKLAKTGNEEEKAEAVKYLNWVNSQVQQLSSDLEGSALRQQSAYDIESGEATYDLNGTPTISRYAKSNNSYQLANHQAFANGDIDKTAVIQADENGNMRYMVQAIVDGKPVLMPYDQVDTGTTYNKGLENSIDKMMTDANMVFNATDANGIPRSNKQRLNRDAYNNVYRPNIEKQLKDLIETQGGKQAIKNYMYNDDRLLDAFISNQVGIPQTIDGKINPDWIAFKSGETSSNMPASYDEFVNNNKFFTDFEDGFVETVLSILDDDFELADKETQRLLRKSNPKNISEEEQGDFEETPIDENTSPEEIIKSVLNKTDEKKEEEFPPGGKAINYEGKAFNIDPDTYTVVDGKKLTKEEFAAILRTLSKEEIKKAGKIATQIQNVR
tara:strand:- start:559 stop:1977 length:1419 start_codon:yes stop_codon:yes gene_type:complete